MVWGVVLLCGIGCGDLLWGDRGAVWGGWWVRFGVVGGAVWGCSRCGLGMIAVLFEADRGGVWG